MKRILLAAVVVATTVLTAAAPAANAAAAITVTQHGAAAPWQGRYYWANFPGSAGVTGTVTGVHQGTAVLLQAQVFPFTHGYTKVAQTATSRNGGYRFTVHPSLATRYRVNSHGTTSRTVTFYVLPAFKLLSQNLCQRSGSACRVSITYYIWYPSSAAQRETAQKLYLYVGLNRTARALPPTLSRKTSFTYTVRQIASTKWLAALGFSYPASGVQWVQWAACTKEIESSDGFGLPVHTGCGSSSIQDNPSRAVVLG